MLKIMRVTGQSLSPEYRDGDFVVLITSPFFFGSVKEGDTVVFHHDRYGILIKKVTALESNGEGVYVTGTHSHSKDSKHFGPIERNTLIGKVIWHISNPQR